MFVKAVTYSISELSTDVTSGPTPGAEAAAAPGSGPSFDEMGGLSGKQLSHLRQERFLAHL